MILCVSKWVLAKLVKPPHAAGLASACSRTVHEGYRVSTSRHMRLQATCHMPCCHLKSHMPKMSGPCTTLLGVSQATCGVH